MWKFYLNRTSTLQRHILGPTFLPSYGHLETKKIVLERNISDKYRWNRSRGNNETLTGSSELTCCREARLVHWRLHQQFSSNYFVVSNPSQLFPDFLIVVYRKSISKVLTSTKSRVVFRERKKCRVEKVVLPLRVFTDRTWPKFSPGDVKVKVIETEWLHFKTKVPV